MNEKYDGLLMSFLDSDLYKFTMQQVVLNKFPQIEVEYEFKCRDKNIESGVKLGRLMSIIEEEINKMENLRITPEEIKYLKTIYFFKDNYIEFLSTFKYNPRKYVRVSLEKGELAIRIKGNWLHTILFEVPVLAIISEIFAKNNINYNEEKLYSIAVKQLDKKIQKIKEHPLKHNFKMADFGTRRRASTSNHSMVVRTLKEQLNFLGENQFVGTSNVHLARINNIKCIGTLAHEYLQSFQVTAPLINHLDVALQTWSDEYEGSLGIALTDSINTDVFLKAFNLKYSKLFDGVRHDSGDPIEFGIKMIQHYKDLGIDPKTKTIVFSDGLDIPKALSLVEEFDGLIKISFGIGTNLTFDFDEVIKPLSIVIKMIGCGTRDKIFPVAKISDTPEKSISGSVKYLEYLKDLYGIDG